MLRPCLALVLAILLAPAVIVRAQSTSATMSGTVTDASGAAVAGASITAVYPAKNTRLAAQSDPAGRYVLTPLQPGGYTLEVTARGFKKFVRSGIELAVQQQARIDVPLSVGELAETVTVNEQVSAIETSNATIGKVVSNKAILNLPLNSRNVYALIFMTPGVAGSIGNNYNSMSYSINGARASMTETLIDGASASHPTVQGSAGISAFPSVDAIGEFKVMGSNYNAEYGHSAGSVVNVVYKSGTNAFHGTLYEFLRNSKLDSNDFFANSRGAKLASFRRHQYGGTFGGPVKKDRTFFMSSYEGLRQNNFGQLTATVPTAQQREGDFSQTLAANRNLIQIFDPFTTRANPAGGFIRDAFAGNVIPASRLNPVARSVMKLYPQSNAAGNAITNANNYYQQGSAVLNIDQFDGRVDHNFTANHRTFMRVSKRNQDSNPAVLFPQAIAFAQDRINEANRMYNGVLDHTVTMNASTIVVGRVAFARSLYNYANQGLDFLASSLGFPAALDTAGGLPMFPRFTASNFVSLGNTDHRYNAFMTYTAAGNITKIHGAHTFKGGYEGRLIRVNNREARSTSGSFGFTAGFTQGPNPNTAAADRGNSLASLFMGLGSGTLIQDFKNVAAQSYYHALYFQDDWRVTNRLTLNLGLRYDLDTPRTERYDRMNYLDLAARSPLAARVPAFPNLSGGLVFVAANGQPRTQYFRDNNNLAPRLGMAYQLDKNTIVRAGVGLYYAISLQQAHGTVGPFGFRTETPWVASLDGITPNTTLSNPYPNGFTAVTGAAGGLLTQAGANIQAPYQDTRTPYSYQWNVSVQRNLPGAILLEAAYVGTRGLHLTRNDEGGLSMNQLNPSYMSLGSQLNEQVANPFFGIVNNGVLAAQRVSRAQLLRPYPQFTDIVPLYSTGSSSTYHSLQTSFNKRFSRGFQFDGSYTWAKAMDNGISHQDSYDIRASRALTTYDVQHRFVLSYIYELPFGKGRKFGAGWNAPVNMMLGGWQVNGFTSLQSGTPLSISASNVSGTFNPRGLANNNGQSAKLDGDIHDRLSRYFNTSVFSQPAAFTYGNTSPQIANLRSPATRNWDLSVFKDFPFRERVRFQLRAEAFNAFNTVRFSGPDTSFTSTNFGVITTQSNSPRQVQFALKVLF